MRGGAPSSMPRSGGRCRGGARRRARDPGRALRRGCRPDRAVCARRCGGRGRLASKVSEGKKAEGAKFSDYFDSAEPLAKMPSHRILAMFRGEKEGDPRLATSSRKTPRSAASGPSPYELRIARTLRHRGSRPAGRQMAHRNRALGLAHQDAGPSRHRSAHAAVEGGGGGGRAGVRRAICATCCSPRRPARARPWASIRASAPA